MEMLSTDRLSFPSPIIDGSLDVITVQRKIRLRATEEIGDGTKHFPQTCEDHTPMALTPSMPMFGSEIPDRLRLYPATDAPRALPKPTMAPRVFEFIFDFAGHAHIFTVWNREAWSKLGPGQRPRGAQEINEGAWVTFRPVEHETASA